MLTILICSIVFLIVGVVLGFLIGRKNPKVQDEVAAFADTVKAVAEKK